MINYQRLFLCVTEKGLVNTAYLQLRLEKLNTHKYDWFWKFLEHSAFPDQLTFNIRLMRKPHTPLSSDVLWEHRASFSLISTRHGHLSLPHPTHTATIAKLFSCASRHLFSLNEARKQVASACSCLPLPQRCLEVRQACCPGSLFCCCVRSRRWAYSALTDISSCFKY